MTSNRAVVAVLLLVSLASLLAFAYVLRQLSLATLGMDAHKEIEQQLRRSLDDQKQLARLDPTAGERYRQRFDATAALIGHLRVMQFNRRDVARRVEQVLLGLVALILTSGIALWLVERRNRERRLVRLEAALAALSRGEQEIVIGDRRRDLIGRIAAAVERSSRAAAQDRRQLRYLEHLSAWQEAARRHAHEIRTPLAAARMEVERFASNVRRRLPYAEAEIDAARHSILEEIDHLGEFTRGFTSFATIPKPRARSLDLCRLVTDFCTTFATAWSVRLECGACTAAFVHADGEMLRQVLANLAGNSALAGATCVTFALVREGNTFLLDVRDDGAGVPREIANRLFEPYTTSRGIGEGMGLGLAISKKIMLDHGGDLDYIRRTPTTFRLTLPVQEQVR
ncbi:MAG TPA: HAMP domain-containing sensor histidine kinase [Thermoanaerobaculia bacterium]